jgi:nitronate monooxygenase
MRQTKLTEMFGLRYPLIQAPMAYAAGGDLAREAARGGALGMIGTGTKASTAWLDEQWQKLQGVGPVGVGFMTWALDAYPEQRAMLRYSLSLRPAAVLLSFGDPTAYIPAIRAAGARVICQVQTPADAVVAAAAGADLLIAQGTEAGGHTGHQPLRPLLAEVLQAAGAIPVAAAGGMATGADVAAVMALGACGGMLGTRFAATLESIWHDRAKEQLLQAGESSTVLTRVFDLVQGIPWPSQYPGRALRNRFAERWHGREADLEAAIGEAKPEYEAARRRADYETLVVYASEAAAQIVELVPAAALVRRIGEELDVACRG